MKIFIRQAIFFCATLFFIAGVNTAAYAQDGSFGDLNQTITATVKEVIDGDTVILKTGEAVRLVGIQAPKLSLGRPHIKDWPLADKSKQELANLTLGKDITIYTGQPEKDRHGRWLGYAVVDGQWVQEKMLAQGMARYYAYRGQKTIHQNHAYDAQLQQAEAAARQSKTGIWENAVYQMLTPKTAHDAVGTYGIVKGKVASVAVRKDRIYINFGPDYKTDFTVVVLPPLHKKIDTFEHLAGKTIEARGWIKSYNGPMIEVDHLEQLKLL